MFLHGHAAMVVFTALIVAGAEGCLRSLPGILIINALIYIVCIQTYADLVCR